ncbi:MAG: DUF5682 family protein [Bacteroidota bacterium]
MIHVFGIRHHGPGSARRVERALEQLQPDYVLIEGPADIEKELQYALHPDLIPPVALLVYDPKNFAQASYFPFAAFSPEWLALRYALRANTPVAFMDLPMSLQFGLRQNQQQELAFEQPKQDTLPLRDPLGYMARLAGYADGERWWEVTFEHESDDTKVFDAVLTLMRALREETKAQERIETLRREAYMRKVIRKVVKAGAQRVAVICGAWHAPALVDWQQYKVSADNQLLKGIKKVKVVSTWIPWSQELLATQSGYGAGVLSPAWYALLFDQPEEVVVQWMARVSSLLRAQDLDASAAHVLEAVRLAETLTALRKKRLPGLEELEEAAVTVFAQGASEPLELIRQKLVIGDQVGQVPDSIPTVPLMKDVEAQVKAARLKKFYQSGTKEVKELDLRTPSNLTASILLHRLHLLGIPWGNVQEGSEKALGSFREIWELYWQPVFAIRLIEMGMWGNTLERACENYLSDRLKSMRELPELTQLTGEALKANLSNLIPTLVQRLQQVSVVTKDVQFLMDAFPALVQIIRYGNTRKTDVRAVEQVANQLAPRICIGLPPICLNIEIEVARDIFKQVLQMNHSLSLYGEQQYIDLWNSALQQTATTSSTHPLLQGLTSRLLFDKTIWEAEKMAERMAFVLSDRHQVEEVVWWLEGFLHGSGLILVHQQALWSILDAWVREIPMTIFMEVVPLLRRAFSNFSEPERQHLLQLAQGKKADQTAADIPEAIEAKFLELIAPGLRNLLQE